MKPIFFLLICALFSGCATGSGGGMSAQQGAAALRVAVSTGATLSLAKNPRYIPLAQALAAGIDGALEEASEITPAAIARYVRAVCAKHDCPPADTAVFVNLAQAVFTAYVTAYRPQVVRATDPVVLLYALAFKNGLADAIAAVNPPVG